MVDRKEFRQILMQKLELLKTNSYAGCPIRFICSILNSLFDENLFDEKKPSLLIEVPYCDAASKHLIKKFHQLANEKYDVAIK